MIRGTRIVRLAALSGFAKAPGFVIPLVLAAFFGAGPLTDAYFIAYGGVLLVGGLVGQPLEASIVPFSALALSRGQQAARDFMRVLVQHVIVIGMSAALFGGGLVVCGLLLSRSTSLTLGSVLGFYVLLMPAAAAWCVGGVYTGALVSAWHLEEGAIAYGFRGVGALAGALVGSIGRQLWPVALGVSLGEWGRVWWLRSRWERVVRVLPQGEPGETGAGFLAAAGHQMAAQGMLAVVQFVERFLAGAVAVAAISHIEYATRLIMVAAVVFDGGVGPWLLAHWSNVRVRATLRSDWLTVYQPLLLAGFAALAIASVLALGAPRVVQITLKHGAFTVEDALAVTKLFRWYAFWYCVNMSSLCVERLLLARTQNRLFASLAAARAIVRLTVIVAALSHLGVISFPVGAIVGEAVYLAGLLTVSRREVGLQLRTNES